MLSLALRSSHRSVDRSRCSKSHSVRNRAPGFLRPLGSAEHFFHLYAQVYPVHFCLCAEIEGRIDAAELRFALSQVRERHPLLRVRTLDDGEFGTALHESYRPIELEAIAAGTDADWRSTVERELQKPLDIGAGASLRVAAASAPDVTAIVLTFHHAVRFPPSGSFTI